MRKATVSRGGRTWGIARPGPARAGTTVFLTTPFNIHADLVRTAASPLGAAATVRADTQLCKKQTLKKNNWY